MSMRLSAAAPTKSLLGEDPSDLSSLLALALSGPELKRVARTTGALIRERAVDGVGGLLRLALTYSVCNFSLNATAAWSRENGSASMSKWGVLYRLRNAGDWLLELVSRQLSRRVPVPAVAGFRVHVVDATRVASSGSKGETARLHAVLDPFTGRLVKLDLTDDSGGERLGRFQYERGSLVTGDRGYAHRRGLAEVVAAGSDFLVRTNARNVPLEHRDSSKFDLFAFLRSLDSYTPGEVEVQTQPDKRNGIPAVAARLVAVRKPEKAAEAARQKVLFEARKKGRTPDPLTLEACSYVMILTSTTRARADATQVLAIYKLRWQVELPFKRMKSIFEFDVLRAKDPGLVKTTLAGKLLAILLVDDLAEKAGTTVNWSFASLVGQAIRQVILGSEAAERVLSNPSRSITSMAESPRARQQQGPVTKALLLDFA